MAVELIFTAEVERGKSVLTWKRQRRGVWSSAALARKTS